MWSKNKKKEIKPTTSVNITRTENTVTTANGYTRTVTQISSYQHSSSSISTVLSSDETSSPKLRSAFGNPTHDYKTTKSILAGNSNENFKFNGNTNSKLDEILNAGTTKSSSLDVQKLPPPKFQNQLKLNDLNLNRPNLNLNRPSLNLNRPSLNLNRPSLNLNQPNLNLNQSNLNNIFNNELNSKIKVKVIKTGLYKGGDSKVPCYNTRSLRNRGKLLLINNIEFKGKKRHGADVDQANMSELFKQIGFNCVTYKNKSKNEMERIIKSFASNSDLKKYDMCVTVVMSHGTTINEQTMIETIDEQLLSTEWVVEQFDGVNCKAMHEKPKIFIFQCCRGDNENVNVQSDAKMFQAPQAPRKVQDILISYSTIPGFVAYRSPELGSYYIQGICKVFMEHAHDTHIEDLLKIVDSELAKLKVGSQRQTSSYENRGFKTCYLNPIK